MLLLTEMHYDTRKIKKYIEELQKEIQQNAKSALHEKVWGIAFEQMKKDGIDVALLSGGSSAAGAADASSAVVAAASVSSA